MLTSAGRALLRDATMVLNSVGQLRRHAASVAEGLEAEVAVAVGVLFPATVLAQLCKAFQDEFPTVPLRLQTGVLGTVATMVLSGASDLGISGPVGIESPKLKRMQLASVRLVPVAGEGHPLAAIDGPIPTTALEDKVQIVISEMARREVADDGPANVDYGVLSARTWRVADAGTKLTLIRAGLGWGSLPEHMVAEDLQKGTLKRLEVEEWGNGPRLAQLFSIVRGDAPPGPAGQWLLRPLRSLCEDADTLTSASSASGHP